MSDLKLNTARRRQVALLAIRGLLGGEAEQAKSYAAEYGIEYDERDDYGLVGLYEDDARYQYPKRNRLAREIAFHATRPESDDALIDAAPDLLEAAEHLVEYIEREGPPAKEWQAISEWTEKLGAAIAKAKGESGGAI